MDHYKTLMVSRAATQEEIQKAYHTLALKYHPDTNPDPAAAEKIRAVNKAYQVLRREKTRQEYDATLGGRPAQAPPNAPKKPGPVNPRPPVPDDFRYDEEDPLTKILRGMGGGGRSNEEGQPRARENSEAKPGGVPTVEIPLTVREASTGATKQIRVNGRLLNIKITIKP